MQKRKSFLVATFKIGDTWLGIPIVAVKEILTEIPVTPVHRLESYVVGLINVRGQVVTVLDLAEKLGIKGAVEDKYHFLILRTNQELANLTVEVMGETIDDPVAFRVGAIGDVIEINDKILSPPPPNLAQIDRAYLKGVAKLEDRLLGILDLEKVLSREIKV